jgi:endonuclease/exonuclease/phosphatase family metal-dependent hydrolase
MPMLQLDRIYVRGLGVEAVQKLVGAPWAKLSDHVALTATLRR